MCNIYSISPPRPSSPATLLFNILAQYIRVGIRLHIQVGPLDCSLGMLGRGRREKKQSKKKKKVELMERRSTITICFLACWGLQANLVHLLWKLTLAGELYVMRV